MPDKTKPGKTLIQEIEKSTSRKKTKRRPPRLTGVSKQRKMANARERQRVHALNKYIENLRELIPLSPSDKRPSKIEVIWMAATYIEFLSELLEKSKMPSEEISTTKPDANTQDVSRSFDSTNFLDVTVADIFGFDTECSSLTDLDLDSLFFETESNECLREDNCIFADNGIDYHLKSFSSDLIIQTN
ncbi:transcription factor Atoh1-like [Montipora foliosa]|uniref:transcription factor Atoh1-like n=1 Tax=Montipora foliosa TaxID=591990 RepID=UPI0035F1013B